MTGTGRPQYALDDFNLYLRLAVIRWVREEDSGFRVGRCLLSLTLNLSHVPSPNRLTLTYSGLARLSSVANELCHVYQTGFREPS